MRLQAGTSQHDLILPLKKVVEFRPLKILAFSNYFLTVLKVFPY